MKPHQTLLTGIGHSLHHEKINLELLKLKSSENLDIQLAYDGEQVFVDLSKEIEVCLYSFCFF